MRTLLTVIAAGSVGVDRPVDALDDHDKLQHGQAWARTGMVFDFPRLIAHAAKSRPLTAFTGSIRTL